jgi:tripartite motif-containing protein 45
MGVAKARKVQFCDIHSEQELEVFCKSCDTPLCKECARQSHTHHALQPLDNASMQRVQLLENLLSQAKPLTTSLTESLQNIKYMLSSIQERSETTAEEIIVFISSHMQALQEHKRSLLMQLDAAKKLKEGTLKVQEVHLNGVLSELHQNCEEAKRVLENGIGFDSAVLPVVSKLEELLSGKFDTVAREDDYLCFDAHATADDRVGGFPMYGVLDSRGPSAAYTIVDGEGLHTAREGKMSQFRVTVNDRFKQRREGGGDKVEARMTGPEGEVVYVFVSDSEDGQYLLSYTPSSRGEHTLHVLVAGKHVRSSPFRVSVIGKTDSCRHGGVFHCCTYCSTKGKKHIRCGCGGTMPGGYSGCGHGHPGHPGRRHWSCCGNTVESSDCLQMRSL